MTTFKYILFGIVTSVLLVSCDPASMDETVKPDEVILKASADRIDASGQDAVTFNVVADGKETVTFTVTQEGEDITGESTLYLLPETGEPIAIEGYTFSTEEAGVHKIYAMKEEASSNTVSIMATPTATFSANDENRLIVSSNVAISENGEYKVSCWLLENNITAVQNTGGYPEPPNYDINNHLNVLRAIYNDDAIGQEITAGANETQSFEWDFDMDALENGNAEDAHVLIVISKKEDNDKFIVNNVIRCDFNDATGYEYAE